MPICEHPRGIGIFDALQMLLTAYKHNDDTLQEVSCLPTRDVIFTHAQCTGWQKNQSHRLSHAKYLQRLRQHIGVGPTGLNTHFFNYTVREDRPVVGPMLTGLANCQICVRFKKAAGRTLSERCLLTNAMGTGRRRSVTDTAAVILWITWTNKPGMHSQE